MKPLTELIIVIGAGVAFILFVLLLKKIAKRNEYFNSLYENELKDKEKNNL